MIPDHLLSTVYWKNSILSCNKYFFWFLLCVDTTVGMEYKLQKKKPFIVNTILELTLMSGSGKNKYTVSQIVANDEGEKENL